MNKDIFGHEWGYSPIMTQSRVNIIDESPKTRYSRQGIYHFISAMLLRGVGWGGGVGVGWGGGVGVGGGVGGWGVGGGVGGGGLYFVVCPYPQSY